MKKTLKLLTCLFLISSILGIAAIATAEEGHVHQWSDWQIDQAATCVEPGLRSHYCTECGDEENEPIPIDPDAHQWSDWQIDQAATCAEQGLRSRHCTLCGDEENEFIPIDPDAHQWSDWQIDQAATCVEQGLRSHYCLLCGNEENEFIDVDPTNHAGPIVDVAAKEATCTEAGTSAGKKCEACGVITEGAAEVAAKGHTWQRNGFDINNKANQTAANGWTVDKQPAAGVAGSGHYNCGDCGTASASVSIEALPETSTKPSTSTGPTTTPEPSKNPSSGNSSSSGSSNAAPAATEAPALPYGSIVSDVERADEPYVPETVADETGANTILVITADPDEDGTYTLRNLHITDELLSQLNTEGILTVRFVVGDATVEFPVASFTGDAVTTIKGDLDADVTAFLVTIDPNATTADGAAGVSVGSSVATADGAEYDVTPLIPDLSLTIGDTPAQPVTTATVYTAQPAAEPAPAEPAVEEAPAEEAPAEPTVEEPAADEAVAA